jgi:hypothetical protein
MLTGSARGVVDDGGGDEEFFCSFTNLSEPG